MNALFPSSSNGAAEQNNDNAQLVQRIPKDHVCSRTRQHAGNNNSKGEATWKITFKWPSLFLERDLEAIGTAQNIARKKSFGPYQEFFHLFYLDIGGLP